MEGRNYRNNLKRNKIMAEKFKIVKDLKTGKQYLAKPHFISKNEHAYFAEYKDGETPKIDRWGLGYGEYNDNLESVGEIEIDNISFSWRGGVHYTS
jgi:hypothetical protein